MYVGKTAWNEQISFVRQRGILHLTIPERQVEKSCKTESRKVHYVHDDWRLR